MYTSRVHVPSREGGFELNLSLGPFTEQLLTQHGELNLANVRFCITAWTALLGDSPLDLKPNKTINRFIKSLLADYRLMIKTYSELADKIVRSIRNTAQGLFIETFVHEMQHTPVFREYLHFTRTGDPVVLKYILSFLWFGKKAYYQDPDFDTIALHKWREVEYRLASIQLPSWVGQLKRIMTFLLKGFTYDEFLPKHGGGAVSEANCRGVSEKNWEMTLTRGQMWTFIKDSIFFPRDVEFPWINRTRGLSECEDSIALRISRMKFVPKDYKTARSICMEPAAFMWTQQAVRRWVEDHIGQHYVLRRHVYLHDQRMNQRAAMIGSKTGQVDTIDLSSASDSVLWLLIKAIMPAKLLRFLSATRSRLVRLPDGSVHQMHKFAPMGSALCFPIQCLVYTAIVLMVSVAQAYGRQWDSPTSLDGIDLEVAYEQLFSPSCTGNRFHPFYVYGDDIALDKRTTSNTIACLRSLGFSVNTEKSFTGDSAYRESCGKHYCNGSDVSPYLFKVKEVAKQVCVATLSGVIDAANRAGDYGYNNLRSHLIGFVLHYPIQGYVTREEGGLNPILFTSDRECTFAIHSEVPRNTHLQRRNWGPRARGTSRDYQRAEYRSMTVRPLQRAEYCDDSYALTQWWRARYGRDGSPGADQAPAKVDAWEAGVGWRWTAT